VAESSRAEGENRAHYADENSRAEGKTRYITGPKVVAAEYISRRHISDGTEGGALSDHHCQPAKAAVIKVSSGPSSPTARTRHTEDGHPSKPGRRHADASLVPPSKYLLASRPDHKGAGIPP